MARKIENMFDPPRRQKINSAKKGDAGYDNARENIDPHVRTGAVTASEGTIQHTPTNSKDIANKNYVDNLIIILTVGTLLVTSIVIGGLIKLDNVEGVLFVNASTLMNGSLTVEEDIYAAGDVGIGTTNPTRILHIVGNPDAPVVQINNTRAGGEFLHMIGDAGDPVFEFNSEGTGGEAVLYMYKDNVLINQISTRSSQDTYFNGGKVGIGLTNPQTIFHINAEVSTIRLSDSNAGTDQAVSGGIQFYRGISDNRIGGFQVWSTSTDEISFFTDYTNAFMTFRTGDAVEQMRIDKDGKVGIGNTTPNDKLRVNGNITSDNVFLPQYIFSHTNETIPVLGASEWTNVTFSQENADLKQGITHDMITLNHTFGITQDGRYYARYDYDVEDTSGVSTDIDVAGRMIYTNGTEVIGSDKEIGIAKKGVEIDFRYDFLFDARAGESFVFQFVATDADVQISTHATFGVHPESASVIIEKRYNLP